MKMSAGGELDRRRVDYEDPTVGDSAVGESKDRAVQVIESSNGEAGQLFQLDEEALKKVLLKPDVCDKKVVVLSVAGAFRKGKSFLLNFFLRYLRHKQQPSELVFELDERHDGGAAEDWLLAGEGGLDGFSWRGGSERETSGILIWSKPFVVKSNNGEKVVVLLMDTQGAFDSQSTVKDCATIFALSTMLSSVQIYNLSQNIQEDDLQHLQLFTEYGRLALEGDDSKPFQALTFLVRDWSFPYEAEYGFEGGQRILDRRLQLSDKQHPELQQLRRHIRFCFDTINCFLMPHPGLKVATNPRFMGELDEIESEFKQQLRSLTPRLLSADSLLIKQIAGRDVTCRELVEYFRAYINIFQGEDLPEPKSMLLATAEANNLAAVASAKALYCRAMEQVCGGDTPFLANDSLDEQHERCRNTAICLFGATKKMGGSDFSLNYLEKLNDEILESYENYKKMNNAKNLFKSMRTPAVLFTLLLINYFLKEFFQLVAFDTFAAFSSLILAVLLITISLWTYIRYSGAMREVGMLIDEIAEWIWQHVLSRWTNEVVKKAVTSAMTVPQLKKEE